MRKPVFNPEITWGHLLQAALICAAVITMYGDSRVYRVKIDYRLERLEEHDKQNKLDIASAREREAVCAAATQKLSDSVAKLEWQMRRPPPPVPEPKRGTLERN